MSVDRKSFAIAILLPFLLVLTSCGEDPALPVKYEGDMVLAISWQPGFCETRPRLRECRSQTAKRYDANHFSLHGLWPQPASRSYCNVAAVQKQLDKSRQWSRLRGLGLSQDMRKRLVKVMPGARSFLHRHEWIKHGTCYSDFPEDYYRDSLLLMEQINGSALRDLFAASIGKRLTGAKIRRAIDTAFGKGSGNRVRIACKRDGNREIITELTIGLSGRIEPASRLADLIHEAPSTRRGCPAGIVDPAGFQ